MNGNQKFSFGHINSKKPVRHPGEDFEKRISQQGGTKGDFGAGASQLCIMTG